MSWRRRSTCCSPLARRPAREDARFAWRVRDAGFATLLALSEPSEIEDAQQTVLAALHDEVRWDDRRRGAGQVDAPGQLPLYPHAEVSRPASRTPGLATRVTSSTPPRLAAIFG